MTVELRNLKGTCDFMPQEQRLRNDIIRKLQEVFECCGYQPLETPIIGYYDILASKYAGGAEILKEVYKFKDQAQRDIGLRYDLTVPFARVVGMNPAIRMPFKRYEIGKVFRNGPVKAGRVREFIQCDVDMVGVKSVMAEAELMVMASDIYKSLGLEVYIAFNNRKLLSGTIEAAGVDSSLEGSVILSIDKLEKIGKEEVREELILKGLEAETIDKLFSFLDMKEEEFLNFFRRNPLNDMIRQGIEELDQLIGYLNAADVIQITRFTPWLARGLEIYTGTVFEVFLVDGSITSSIGAGGRYDKIIGAFLDNGTEYPAVGMTFGLDVIYAALAMKNAAQAKPPVDIFIIPINTQNEAIKILNVIRRNGIAADIEMDKRKVKKSLEYANKTGIPYVLILGEDEIKVGKIKLRNMIEGSETEEDMRSLEEVLKNIKHNNI